MESNIHNQFTLTSNLLYLDKIVDIQMCDITILCENIGN